MWICSAVTIGNFAPPIGRGSCSSIPAPRLVSRFAHPCLIFWSHSGTKILPVADGLPGDPAPGEGARQRVAAPVEGGTDGTGGISQTGLRNWKFTPGELAVAFAANQRDEVRDLHDVAGALSAQPGMKQQTFVAGITAKGNGDCFLSEERHTALSGGGGMPGQGYPAIFTAAFSAGAGASAGSIGYGEEVSPTLKGTASGNCMPSILCLNDQGGRAIACSENVAGTLRAQEHGHQSLVFENHGIDARYTGPHSVAPTMSARYGTGGNKWSRWSQNRTRYSVSPEMPLTGSL